MACPKCGASLAAGMNVCAVCGESVRAAVRESSSDAPTYAGAPTIGPAGRSADSDDPARVQSYTGAETMAARPGTAGAGSPPPLSNLTGPLVPGSAFGSRYHLIRLLGMGGMGAVYQAWDEELGVSVALKVIRPEITADPTASPENDRRYNREHLNELHVTHKNV
jgi:hypothetical protein